MNTMRQPNKQASEKWWWYLFVCFQVQDPGANTMQFKKKKTKQNTIFLCLIICGDCRSFNGDGRLNI